MKDCTSTLRGPGARMLCPVYVFQALVTWFGPSVADELSTRIFGNPVRRSIRTGI